MGAVVSAYDVRAVTQEQVESLGGVFLRVGSGEAGGRGAEDGSGSGGYAREMSDDYKLKEVGQTFTSIALNNVNYLPFTTDTVCTSCSWRR